MHAQEMISVRDVIARWVYTELVDGHHSHCYSSHPGVEAIKEKRRLGTSFDQLSDEERAILFAEWSMVRSFFAHFLENVKGYQIEQWRKDQVALARVTPRVDQKYRDYPLLGLFFLTEADDPADPRNAHKERRVVPLDDPITIGLHNGNYVILDGLHRANTFLCSAILKTIPVYVPVPHASG